MKKWPILLCLITLVVSVCLSALNAYFIVTDRLQQPDDYVNCTETPIASPNSSETEKNTVADIAEKCTESVVSIKVEQEKKGYNGGSAYSETAVSYGTGVIIREDGYIVTCYHVVEGADSITVTMDNQTELTATQVGHDEQFDLAVISVHSNDLPAVKLGNSDDVVPGEEVVVIGNPLGEFGSSVTAGVLSAPSRELTIDGTPLRLMQMDAAVNPGNSGGALLNMQGQLIGIVNAKVSASGIEGIAFSIPWNSIRAKVDSIINSGNSGKKAVLGVGTKNAVCYEDGKKIECVEISTIREGSAADKAGLKKGDYLLSANGNTLKDTDDLTLAVKYLSPGDQLKLEVYRNNKRLEVSVILSSS